MRVTALVLAGLLGVLALEGVSHAEKVRANDAAKIYNRPGEQGKIILKVKEGQAMTVLAKQGRWLKVRVKGRTGFVPRSKVSAPDGDEEIARNTRRRPFVDGRSTKRTFGGGGDAPEDRIGADAIGENEEGGEEEGGGEDAEEEEDPKPSKTAKSKKPPKEEDDSEEEIDDKAAQEEEPEDAEEVEEEEKDPRKRARVASKTMTYSEPDKDSDESFEASSKDVLFVEQTKGKWTEVSVEEGDIGWILTSKLEMADEEEEEEDGGGGRGGRRIDLRARLGITLFSQSLKSPGTMALDNYNVGSSAAAVSLGGALVYPYKKAYLVGGEVQYDISKALPGITYENKTTAFTMHNLNVRGLFGYDFKKDNGMVVFGRLGYHYESLLFADVEDLTKNNAMLPSESLKGPMLGVMFAIPALTKKIGARISLDAILVGGSLSQTKGLEDGADPSVRKVVFGAGGIYRYKPGWDINIGYDLNYASIAFGAAVTGSMRQHGASASRKDLNHTISVGLAKAL